MLAEEEARPAFTALSIVENSLPKRLSSATAAQGRSPKVSKLINVCEGPSPSPSRTLACGAADGGILHLVSALLADRRPCLVLGEGILGEARRGV